MAKTQRELAFLRDLYIQEEWTKRFTDLVDKHIDLSDSENLLYINAGTGSHAVAIAERFGEKTDVFAVCEDEDILNIARDKAAAVRSGVDFSCIRFEDDSFDVVLADATFIRPAEIGSYIENAVRTARTGGDVALFLPSSGSYGEIFSLLWEILFNDDLAEHGHAVETMISELPTVSRLKEMAEATGMVNINTETACELFEFENGAEFIASPLVADFLLPAWLEMLDDEQEERVQNELAQLIDTEDGTMSFRFSVKATLLTGEKA
jgi:ubiquinone/menaquinone biosynthesis C-methylase UbiE